MVSVFGDVRMNVPFLVKKDAQMTHIIRFVETMMMMFV